MTLVVGVGGLIGVEPGTVEVVAIGLDVVWNLHVTGVVPMECPFELERDCELAEDRALLRDTNKRETDIAFKVCLHTLAKALVDIREHVATKGLRPKEPVSHQDCIRPPLETWVSDQVIDDTPVDHSAVTTQSPSTLSRCPSRANQVRQFPELLVQVTAE